MNTLRSAQSTPYIRTNEVTGEKENSNDCIAIHPDNQNVVFNTGCSSSSSDLTQLLEIYNDLGENADFEEWMKNYKIQRLQDEKNCSSSSIGNDYSLSDSYGNLITPNSCSTQSVSRDQVSNYINANIHHRSMDVLPTIKEGFYALEKCVSVEFPSKIMMQPSKLCRSKEMPNILDEDGYE